ncbi:hypothetical protein GCM10009824_27600 [Kocuria atrinae]|uniref:Uncharacterized protein n=1 Tax=Kocuria atrinae TaxID=592377 RepID=A0ABP5JW53_9MICC
MKYCGTGHSGSNIGHVGTADAAPFHSHKNIVWAADRAIYFVDAQVVGLVDNYSFHVISLESLNGYFRPGS